MRGTSRSHKYKPGPVRRCYQIRGYGKYSHQIREKVYGIVPNFNLRARRADKRQGVPATSGAPPAYRTPQLPTLTPQDSGVSPAIPAAPIWGERFEGAARRVLPCEDAFVRSAERAPPVCFSPSEGLKTRGCSREAAGPLGQRCGENRSSSGRLSAPVPALPSGRAYGAFLLVLLTPKARLPDLDPKLQQ